MLRILSYWLFDFLIKYMLKAVHEYISGFYAVNLGHSRDYVKITWFHPI